MNCTACGATLLGDKFGWVCSRCPEIYPEAEKMFKLVNLTPHDIHLYRDGKKVETIPSSGSFARAEETNERKGALNGFPVLSVRYGSVNNLPEPVPGTFYIVSQITAVAAKSLGRDDCVIVSDTLRNDRGQIVGCRAFAVV